MGADIGVFVSVSGMSEYPDRAARRPNVSEPGICVCRDFRRMSPRPFDESACGRGVGDADYMEECSAV